MGSIERSSVQLGITTLNRSGHRFSSRFESYCIQEDPDDGAHISWTAKDMPSEDGWAAYGYGTLFVKSSIPQQLFCPRIEERDDVSECGGRSFVYSNGFHIPEDDHGIYHIVFPQYCVVTSIDYQSGTGPITAIYTRVFMGRPVLTWLFKNGIKLRIAFDFETSAKRFERELTADKLYDTATKVPQPSLMKRLTSGINVKDVLSSIPDIIKGIGGS